MAKEKEVASPKASDTPSNDDEDDDYFEQDNPLTDRGSGLVIDARTKKVVKKHRQPSRVTFAPVPQSHRISRSFRESELIAEDELGDDEVNAHHTNIRHSFEDGLVSEEDQRAIELAQIDLQQVEERERTDKHGKANSGNRRRSSTAARKEEYAKRARGRSSGKLYAVFEPEHKPVFVVTIAIMCFAVMFLELYLNKKWYENHQAEMTLHQSNVNMTNSTAADEDVEIQKCPLLIWKFCLESPSVNFMIGPRTDVMLDMGAKRGLEVVEKWQFWRLFSCMFLHAGVIHVGMNMLAFLQLGVGIERAYGTWKVMTIYFVGGFFGSVTSTIFSPDTVGVGASGAIFALFGAAWGDLLQNWALYDTPFQSMVTLAIGTAFNLGLGTMPFLDNFAHFFGFCMGGIVSFSLLVSKRQTSSGREVAITWFHFFLEFLPVVIVPFLNFVALIWLYTGVNPHTVCESCRAINCIPFPWGCDVYKHDDCMWDCNTCQASGVTADANYNIIDGQPMLTDANVTLHCPVLTDWTNTPIVDVPLQHQDITNFGKDDFLLWMCKTHCPDAYL